MAERGGHVKRQPKRSGSRKATHLATGAGLFFATVVAGLVGPGTGAEAGIPNSPPHVFVQAASGHLVEYIPDHQNGNIWNAYDLTATAGGGAPVTGNPTVVEDDSGGVLAFVPGPSGHLTEYVADNQNGKTWNAYDLTADAGGGAPVTGSPSAVFDFTQGVFRVYVPGPGGHLIEYVPDHQNGKIWNAYDLTTVAGGGAPATGNPAAAFEDDQGIVHVYVPGPGGHLDEYVPDHQNGTIWNAYDLTLDAGGGSPVTGAPVALFDFGARVLRLYVPGPGGHLTEYVPDHQNGKIWNGYDLTADAGGGSPVTGNPSAMFDFNQNVIRVYVSDPGHLAEYVPDHQNGKIWNAYDLTADAGGGVPVMGTPDAVAGLFLS
jgi:hypothetical protein